MNPDTLIHLVAQLEKVELPYASNEWYNLTQQVADELGVYHEHNYRFGLTVAEMVDYTEEYMQANPDALWSGMYVKTSTGWVHSVTTGRSVIQKGVYQHQNLAIALLGALARYEKLKQERGK